MVSKESKESKYSMSAIGKRLDSGITDKGLDYETLGKEIGVSDDVVKNWVYGRTRMPIEKACEICDLFGWPLDRLAVRGEWDDQELAKSKQSTTSDAQGR